MKPLTAFLFFIFFLHTGQAQTLFTYGPGKVSKQEFLKAYQKNNTETASYQTAVADYLELYTRFKLKVQAAYDARMDTLPNQRADIQSFRRQIEGPFLTDTAAFNKLVEEAYNRSLKEINLSHIFIPYRSDFSQNPGEAASSADSLAAQKKAQQVRDRLKAGDSFEELARIYSADKASAAMGGKLGNITVFTLPYALENVAYGLGNQQVSDPVSSAKGIHFFKKNNEQAAKGRMKAAQILIAFEPDAGPGQKAAALKLADSLFQAIQSGADFSELAARFSNDKNTLAIGGVMPEFGIGQFEPAFEDQVYTLKEKGQVSRPIESSFGYHIVKLIDRFPVEKDQQIAYPLLRASVQQDDRNKLAVQSFEKKVFSKVGFKKASYNSAALWRMTDSFNLRDKKITAGTLNQNSALFKMGLKNVLVNEWLVFAKEKFTASGNRDYPSLMKSFETASCMAHYQEHLALYDPLFREQLQEFAEGNLLFEVMEKKVWNKAAQDTAGLRKYYQQNPSKYLWAPSVDGIIFSTSDKKSAEEARLLIQQNPGGWKSIMESSGGRIIADSSRFEITQLSDSEAAGIRPGSLSSITENESDKSASFYYIVKVYPKSTPRNFDDARGMVMNDYQQELEEKWIAELKKKYPVKLNQEVWRSILGKR